MSSTSSPAPRTHLPEPLSGLPEAPLVELGGRPWLTRSEINGLLRRQPELARQLARAWLLEQLLAAIPLTAARAEELQQAWLQQQGFQGDAGDAAARAAWLQQQHLSAEDLLQQATATERLERFRRHRWGSEVEVHFLRRKPRLDQVVYSLLRVSERQLAEELHQRLCEGEADFAALAARYAEGPERQSRGLIGPLPLTTAHPEISSRLRVGQPGQLWPPFAVGEVWVLLRLEQQLPARLNSETSSRMMAELFEAWMEERVGLLLAGEALPPLPPLPAATEELPER
jgi:parvulin-like peptidyl-prolyl isomerase